MLLKINCLIVIIPPRNVAFTHKTFAFPCFCAKSSKGLRGMQNILLAKAKFIGGTQTFYE